MAVDIERLGPAAQKQIRDELERRRRADMARERQARAKDGPLERVSGADSGSRLEDEYYMAYIWPKEISGDIVSVERHKRFELLPKSDYCGLRLPAAHYTPDFVIEYKNGTVEVVEVKHEAIRGAMYIGDGCLSRDTPGRTDGFSRSTSSGKEENNCGSTVQRLPAQVPDVPWQLPGLPVVSRRAGIHTEEAPGGSRSRHRRVFTRRQNTQGRT